MRPIDTATRERKPLSGLWRFALDPGDAGRRERWWERPLPGDLEVPVPASYNDLFADIAVRDHVGDAEGTALGAAALGLFALGRAPDLGGAVEQLSDPAAAEPVRIDPDPELAATYRRQRAAVPPLISALSAVAGLLDDGS